MFRGYLSFSRAANMHTTWISKQRPEKPRSQHTHTQRTCDFLSLRHWRHCSTMSCIANRSISHLLKASAIKPLIYASHGAHVARSSKWCTRSRRQHTRTHTLTLKCHEDCEWLSTSSNQRGELHPVAATLETRRLRPRPVGNVRWDIFKKCEVDVGHICRVQFCPCSTNVMFLTAGLEFHQKDSSSLLGPFTQRLRNTAANISLLYFTLIVIFS